MSYDRASTGWAFVLGQEHAKRSAAERVRCGPYTAPDGTPSWGDHRVTYPGTTCIDVDCHVAHHPTAIPGWHEPADSYYARPGAQPIAAALDGWDAGGILPTRIGSIPAWVAAHVALDALRDAGYTITPPPPKDPT